MEQGTQDSMKSVHPFIHSPHTLLITILGVLENDFHWMMLSLILKFQWFSILFTDLLRKYIPKWRVLDSLHPYLYKFYTSLIHPSLHSLTFTDFLEKMEMCSHRHRQVTPLGAAQRGPGGAGGASSCAAWNAGGGSGSEESGLSGGGWDAGPHSYWP